ncbi:MAG: SAM-dependent methyltransferase [Rhodovulum sulfidophilum]|uniref:SAM-dependent methyltransferase n=1 Tax=Rhodovulum sulfidophilum TaxID=35806 RepID=A0A2W5NB15_RHOSU|nr:MAG: SAM-dependent methyltransferase [Rhodovulum sulfidophilum]
MQVITTLKGQKGLPPWFAASFEVLKGIETGRVDIALPDGRIFRVEGGEGPTARLDVRDPELFARVAREGELGFCEAYMDGWWDTPDLQVLLDVLLSSKNWVRRNHPLAMVVRLYQGARHWMNRNTKDQARKNISYHYDLGNQFYGRWLDETMTYSSAIFENPAEELAAAQRRKYASVCDRIGVTPDAQLLEIGCGWGGFAEFAAKERGAKVRGLTISREQHDFARERMFRQGLNERVEIVMRDYRDEKDSFDGIASIEMFEAVGEKYWPVYFDAVRERLRPGAQATLQVITVADSLFPTYRKTVDFIQKYIFPGGMLPSPTALRSEIERAGLRFVGSIEFGQSYSETLRRWHGTFESAWDEIKPLGFDERFRRMWVLYLTSCAAAFRGGTTDVTQVTMARAG